MAADKIADPGLPKGALAGLRTRVGRSLVGDQRGRGLRVGIACSAFNGSVTWRLLEGALAACETSQVDRADITVAWVPGAFELPLVALGLARGGTIDAVVCLGAVIRGETGHYDFVAGQCAQGLQQVQLQTGCPIIFGVLTTETVDQALTRSRPGSENKGFEAVVTAIEMANLMRSPSMSPGLNRGRATLSKAAAAPVGP